MMPGPTKAYEDMYKIDSEGCWLYTGCVGDNGYGRARGTSAHRYAYEKRFGPVADGMHVDHLCHEPSKCKGGTSCKHRRCINPEHLAVVTPRENVLRSNSFVAHNAAATHCPEGHPYEGDNLIVRPNQRTCRICQHRRDRGAKARRAELRVTGRNLKPVHVAIVSVLSNGDTATDAELAARIGVVRQTVVLHRRELAVSGFLQPVATRAAVPGRRPAITYSLTSKGKALS